MRRVGVIGALSGLVSLTAATVHACPWHSGDGVHFAMNPYGPGGDLAMTMYTDFADARPEARDYSPRDADLAAETPEAMIERARKRMIERYNIKVDPAPVSDQQKDATADQVLTALAPAAAD